MELNIESQKQEFLTICRASIQREGLEDLLDWLCKADFFSAPASTKYHGGYPGGLCQQVMSIIFRTFDQGTPKRNCQMIFLDFRSQSRGKPIVATALAA